MTCRAIVCMLLALLLIFAGGPFAVCQAQGGGSSHNENGLKYFKKGFYEYAPHNKHQEANQYYEMAAAEFKKAIAANEGDAAAHRNLARVYHVQQKYALSAAEYKRVTELNPQDVDAYVNLAVAYTHLNRFDEATRAARAGQDEDQRPRGDRQTERVHREAGGCAMKTTIIHTIRRGISGKSSLRRWPLAAVLAALLLAVAVSPSVAGSPHSAFYSSENNRIFWFIHASDLHVGTSGSTDSNNLSSGSSRRQRTRSTRPSSSSRAISPIRPTDNMASAIRTGPTRRSGISTRASWTGKWTAGILLRHPGKPRRLQRREFRLLRSQFGPGPGDGPQDSTPGPGTSAFGEYHFLGVNTADNSGDAFSIFSPYGGLRRSRLVGTHLHRLGARGDTRPPSLTLVFGPPPPGIQPGTARTPTSTTGSGSVRRTT